MKAKMTNWMMLMMAMFIMLACNNEDDSSDIMNSNNLLTENIEIFEIEEASTKVECPDENHKASLFYCFENKSELNGLYTIDDMDLLNWNNRTLVVVHIFYPSTMANFTKNVYKKDGKYVVELLEKDSSDIRFMAHDHRCFVFLLDSSNIKKEDIQLKVGIQTLNDKGEIHHEFI